MCVGLSRVFLVSGILGQRVHFSLFGIMLSIFLYLVFRGSHNPQSTKRSGEGGILVEYCGIKYGT